MLSNISHGFEHGAWFSARSIDTLCVTGLFMCCDFDTDHFEPGDTLAATYCLDAPELMPAGSCHSSDDPFWPGDVYTSQSYVPRPDPNTEGGAA